MRYDHLIGTQVGRWTQGHYTPGQLDAWRDWESPFILMSGSYRSGKSEIGSRCAIRHALAFPNAKVGVFRRHLASLKKSTLINVLELMPKHLVEDWSNTDLVMRLANGSTIQFIGIDFPDRLGSIELSYAFVDEASEVSEESLGMIQGRLSAQLSVPCEDLSGEWLDYAQSTVSIRQVLMACNPKSTSHYLYKNFIEKPKPGHVCYTSNSISNLNLPDNYLVNNLLAYVKQGYSHDWVLEQVRLIRQGLAPGDGKHLTNALTPFGQRNLLGMWVAMEGAIYDLDDRVHNPSEVPEDWGEPQEYFACVDWGFQNPRLAIVAHYPVHTVSGTQSRYAMVDGWNEAQSTPSQLLAALDRFDHKYDFSRVYLPPDQPGLIKEARSNLGASRIKKAKNEVLPGINTVSRFLAERRFLILGRNEATKKAWGEMSGYQWEPDKDGGYKDSPVKKDDHYPDAFRYLIYTRHHRDASILKTGEEDD